MVTRTKKHHGSFFSLNQSINQSIINLGIDSKMFFLDENFHFKKYMKSIYGIYFRCLFMMVVVVLLFRLLTTWVSTIKQTTKKKEKKLIKWRSFPFYQTKKECFIHSLHMFYSLWIFSFFWRFSWINDDDNDDFIFCSKQKFHRKKEWEKQNVLISWVLYLLFVGVQISFFLFFFSSLDCRRFLCLYLFNLFFCW